MRLSMPSSELAKYFSTQIEHLFPDGNAVRTDIQQILDYSLDRLHFCFRHVAFSRYNFQGDTVYSHLYADHNIVLYWLLANSAFTQLQNSNLASKFYYLNKAMH